MILIVLIDELRNRCPDTAHSTLTNAVFVGRRRLDFLQRNGWQ